MAIPVLARAAPEVGERRRAGHHLLRDGRREAEHARHLRALGFAGGRDPRLGQGRARARGLEVARGALHAHRAAAGERQGLLRRAGRDERRHPRPLEHVPHLVAPDVALPLLLAQVARVALALEEDEHVLGARAGDVEEPRLLRPLAVELLPAVLLQAEVPGHHAPARVDRPAHDAERVVERGHAVVELRTAAQVGDDHGAELEPLRLVDGHQAHHVVLLGHQRRLRLARLRLGHAADGAHEVAQGEEALALPVARQLDQLAHVGHLARALELGQADRLEVGRRARLHDQLGDRGAAGERTQPAQEVADGAQRRRLLRQVGEVLRGAEAAGQRRTVRARRPGEPPERAVVEREEGRAERGGERHAVLGIEDGGEQAHDVAHLLALEEAAPLDDVVRQLAPAERVLVRLHLGEGAQEDGDVAVADAVLGVQALDDARQHARLQLARLGRPQLALVVLVDEGDEPHRRRRARDAAVREEALPRVEAGPVARATARRHLEDRRRERVHEVEDRRDGTEVGPQGQLAPELRAHVLEDGDVGAPEAVDRLLLVAHHEHERRGRARRQEAHDLGLHAVGVLELVDQDGAEAAGVALAHGGVPRQDGARLADEVVEGEDGVLALAGAERVADGRDQAGEALVLRQRAQHAVRLGERPLETPARLHRELGLHRARERRSGQQRAQRAQLEELLERRLGAEAPEPLLPGRPRLCERLGAPSPARLGEARVDRRDQARHGGAQRLAGLGCPLRLPRRRRHQPGAVASGAAEPGEEVRDQPDGTAARPAGEPRAQHELARRAVAGAEVRQQRGLYRALDVGPALVLVEHDGARIDPGLERVLAQDAGGEGVDGGDLRPQEVAAHARPVRAGRRGRRPELVGDHLADLARHLRRRLLGEGDGEDLAHLGHRAVRAEEMHEAPRQHRGLPRARPGAHGGRAGDLDRRTLLVGRHPALRHRPSPPRAADAGSDRRRGTDSTDRTARDRRRSGPRARARPAP